jgi:hypothetical protein
VSLAKMRAGGVKNPSAAGSKARGGRGLGTMTILKCTTHIRPTALMRGETEWSK